MKKILHIISSPMGGASLSIKLGNAVIEKIQAKYPGSTVHTRNLPTEQFPNLEEAHINSIFTPTESRTPEQAANLKNSDEAIQEVTDADIIVIGVPFYNFGIPAILKTWIDHITRSGVTFRYTENGPLGLIQGKKAYFAISSGGIYTEGPMKAYDFTAPYLNGILGFLGITDTTTFRIEGIAIPGYKDTAIEKGLNSIVID